MWRMSRVMKVSGDVSVIGYTSSGEGAEVMDQAWKKHVSIDWQRDRPT